MSPIVHVTVGSPNGVGLYAYPGVYNSCSFARTGLRTMGFPKRFGEYTERYFSPVSLGTQSPWNATQLSRRVASKHDAYVFLSAGADPYV